MGSKTGNVIVRYLVASVGLFMIAFAIALAIKSNLGTAPLSCLAYVLNLDMPGISVGVFTFIVNMFYILVQLAVLRRRFNGPRQVFTLLLLISGLLVFTDWFHGYRGYSIDLVIPILCSVTLVCNFVFAFWRSHFTQNALVYMLLNIGVGVLPYLLLFFRIGTGRLDTHSIPWVICLIISAVTCLGLIIFQGRALRSELEKRLHM